MKTRFMKFTLAASLALALAFTFSCSSGDDGNGNQPRDGSDYTVGWPSNALLTKYDLSGMTVPAGATNIEHQEITAAAGGLSINFKGFVDNGAIDVYIAGCGWNKDVDSSWEDETGLYYLYIKGADMLTYGWAPLNGGVIFVVKNYEPLATSHFPLANQ